MLSLLKNLDQIDIILASESPRRYELLKMIGLEFKVRPSHIEEKYTNNMSPLEYARSNAREKGLCVAQKQPDSLIISADTIVVYKGLVMEKPRDEGEALEILEQLSGHTHEVITAYSLIMLNKNHHISDYEITRVTFRSLKQEEIQAYILSGEPFDKAGGYGAQGQGSLLIRSVNGCYFNVVGFPLSKFFTSLDHLLLNL